MDDRFVCCRCSSDLIQPLEWEPVGDDEWRVLIRCPECFLVAGASLDTRQKHLFQNMLDEATHSLEQAAEALDGEVFRDTCRGFAQALHAGLIYPMDF